MERNENRIVFIKSTLEQVKDGIEKGRWRCIFDTQDFPKQDTEVRYWAVTAISADYIIEIGYELEFSSDRVDDYWFSITKNDKVVYQMRESNGTSDDPELTLMRGYMKILVEEYKKVVISLPD
jgi:hypothetical protein